MYVCIAESPSHSGSTRITSETPLPSTKRAQSVVRDDGDDVVMEIQTAGAVPYRSLTFTCIAESPSHSGSTPTTSETLEAGRYAF
jgi:hypothetical protein